MDETQIRQVRSFNRVVTRRIGALGDDYLGRGRPLAESRVLFEIGREGADVRDLRARLSLDSGYLSRLLRSLEAQALVTSQRAPDDGRARDRLRPRGGPSARGLGIAQRMIDALERHAARLGLDRLQLDTNRSLGEARALYARNGYREVARYNDNPYADHWFEKRGLRRRARNA